MIDIGQELYADLNKTYRISLPKKGTKEHFGKNRVMDEFLTDFHNLREQQKKQLEEDHEPKENDFDPAWGEVNSLYGVKNNENRFVKVEPRDFVDFVRDEEWLDYFELRVVIF